MADVKISDLAADSSPESTALIEIETAGGLSRKITLAQVSGASPGGSGSELQHRSGAISFGGATGTHWDVATGRLSIGAGTSPAGMVHAQASAASVIPAVLQGAASQTAALQQWQDSAGTPIADISPLKQFSLYNIAGANYELGRIQWVSNVLTIGTLNAGTGSARAVAIQAGGVTAISIGTSAIVSIGALNITGAYGLIGNGSNPLYGFSHSQTPTTLTSYTLTGGDSGVFYIATSGSDQTLTMPASPSAGMWYGFKVSTSKSSYLRFTANTGQKIRLAGGLSASGGYVRSNVGGSFLYLMYDSTDAEWVAWQQGGTWTIDS